MKKFFILLLGFVSILTLAACHDSPDAGTTNSESKVIEESTAATPPLETPPLTYTVKYVGADGEVVSPLEELMFLTDIEIYTDGSYSQLDGDGYLAFYSVPNYLPLCADKIPTVMIDEGSEIVISARDGVSFDEITAVDVYGEEDGKYLLLAEAVPLSDIADKGETEWKNQVLYLYFDVGFSDMHAAYEKSVRNGYFVKTLFADTTWGTDVRVYTSDLGYTIPHSEMLYAKFYRNGHLLAGDGVLMFIPVSEHLPTFADRVPTVNWTEDFRLVYRTDDGVTWSGGETFYVYGEDYQELARAISRDELITKSKTDWQAKTVYIQFGGVFFHKINEEITENMENAYFVRAIIP